MSSLSVLLVEDDKAISDLVGNALRPWKDELFVYQNAGSAMEQQRAVDVALVDLDVQKGAGLALVHFFRARDPNLAIVAITSPGDAEGEVVAHALGVNATVPKPLTGDSLLVALSSIREKKAARLSVAERHGALPIAPVLQAEEPQVLAAALAEAARNLTQGATRVVLDDAREGAVESRAGMGEPSEAHPLAAHDETIGTLYVMPGASAPVQSELDLLALSGATLGVMLRRLDNVARVGIKDPDTSAYTFAYFVDVAGREIERARRHGRRFALLTFLIDNYAELRSSCTADALREARRELVDTILDTVRDTDVVANVEEDELYLLVPEAGMLGALACRRRVSEKQRKRAELAKLEGRPSMQVTIGVATYPRDGRDLTALLRAAHKRNNAARDNLASAVMREFSGGLEALLGGMLRFRPDESSWQTRQSAISGDVLAALAGGVAREATRVTHTREAIVYILGDKAHPLVRGAVESVNPSHATGGAAYWLRPKSPDGRSDTSASGTRTNPVEIEVDGLRVGPFALVVALTESWAYACVASEHGAYKRVMHTCELDVVEALLAELQTTFHLQRGLE